MDYIYANSSAVPMDSDVVDVSGQFALTFGGEDFVHGREGAVSQMGIWAHQLQPCPASNGTIFDSADALGRTLSKNSMIYRVPAYD
jgi:hypothetical protein